MSDIDFEETLGIKNQTIIYILVVVIIGFCFTLGVFLHDYLYDLTQEGIQQHRKNMDKLSTTYPIYLYDNNIKA
jgi:hypothetical protein